MANEKVVEKKLPGAKDLTDEAWREYSWLANVDGKVTRIAYRIENPVALYLGETTHRIVDAEVVVHCVPTVGRSGCVLRWQAKPGRRSVSF